MEKHFYGWRPQKPDQRDKIFAPQKDLIFPPLIDLRPLCPPVYDQGQLGSCVLNAIAGVVEYDLKKQGMADFMPSRLFMYYNTRKIEHTITSDSGCAIRDAIKSINKYGTCDEKLWPYIIGKFTAKPSAKCYTEAQNDKAVDYRTVNQTMNDMKASLVNGWPFIIGISVYESFESDEVAKTGIVPMPQMTERVLGGHGMASVGYDDSKQAFIVRNSWSRDWGIDGYCYIPYAYLTNQNLSNDFWLINLIGK
jgi:C1A family cysteine protease